ncbi:MAG: hypothetical protein HY291_12615 [Planctomycetes bacterium]|nr:hypothetical protein [Planctomycetota bacterium]
MLQYQLAVTGFRGGNVMSYNISIFWPTDAIMSGNDVTNTTIRSGKTLGNLESIGFMCSEYASKEKELVRWIRRNINVDRVKRIYIDHSLNSLGFVGLFENLEDIRIHNPRITDFTPLKSLSKLHTLILGSASPTQVTPLLKTLRLKQLEISLAKWPDIKAITSCKTIETLKVTGWPFADVSPIDGSGIKNLSITKSNKLRTVNFSDQMTLHRLKLVLCNAVKKVEAVKMVSLWVQYCNALDVQTFRNIVGLRNLRYDINRPMESLGFVEGCRDLLFLYIISKKGSMDRLDCIANHPLLKEAIIGSLNNEGIEFIGRRNKKLSITNDFITFEGGKLIVP